jgi:hypothetical protein
MGYSQVTWRIFNRYLKNAGFLKGKKLPVGDTLIEDESYFGKEMLELGCQVFRAVRVYHPSRYPDNYSRFSCDYFNSIGIRCLSVDLKKCGVSMVLDLRDPLPEYFHNRFDIVSNSGTTEHVETLEGQYEAFKNLHNCVKENGIMIHFVPIKEKCDVKHSPFFYTCKFFEVLAKLNNYEIIGIEEYNRAKTEYYCAVCLRKKDSNNFTEDKEEFFKYIDMA